MFQAKLKREESMRNSSESSAAAAEEKANHLERKLNQLLDIPEREKKNLQDELKYLKEDSKLSISRLRADVSNNYIFFSSKSMFLSCFILICFDYCFAAGKSAMPI